MGNRTVRVVWLGRQPYEPVLALQRGLQATRRDGGSDWLLLLEHDPVFTLGRQHGLPKWRDPARGATSGIPVVQAERGGDITYHGPGQLVAYAILDLVALGIGAGDLVRGLEEAAIRTAAEWGVAAERDPRNRGAWARGRKIAQVGISVRGGVSMHGLALNVATDPSHFALIEACGLPEVEATTLVDEAGGAAITVEAVGRALARQFAGVFGVELAEAEPPAVLEGKESGLPPLGAGRFWTGGVAKLDVQPTSDKHEHRNAEEDATDG